MPGGGCYNDGEMPPLSERTAFEEYRYDALGRRVLTRARQELLCHGEGAAPNELLPDCIQSVVRTVWDGDQILYEISAPGGSGVGPGTMEADVGHRESYLNPYHGYGRVAYAHGLGIDDPLSVTRMEYSDSISWPLRIVPSSNWAGRYDGGLGRECVEIGTGTRLREDEWEPGEDQAGPVTPEDGPQQHCVEVDWPALGMWMNFGRKPSDYGRRSWMGSLIQHGRDPSGQYYRRNRYYDATSGRFTQEDPIGLAGGLNVYGYANGDPVSYTDPFGLCPKGSIDLDRSPIAEDCIYALQPGVLVGPLVRGGGAAVGGAGRLLGRAGASIRGGLRNAGIVREARSILRSQGMATLRQASQRGESAMVKIGGRTVRYEPSLNASGFTMSSENGFVLGREAFTSRAELTKTVLQELYRLGTSEVIGQGASAASAASETAATARFVESAYKAGRAIGLW